MEIFLTVLKIYFIFFLIINFRINLEYNWKERSAFVASLSASTLYFFYFNKQRLHSRSYFTREQCVTFRRFVCRRMTRHFPTKTLKLPSLTTQITALTTSSQNNYSTKVRFSTKSLISWILSLDKINVICNVFFLIINSKTSCSISGFYYN